MNPSPSWRVVNNTVQFMPTSTDIINALIGLLEKYKAHVAELRTHLPPVSLPQHTELKQESGDLHAEATDLINAARSHLNPPPPVDDSSSSSSSDLSAIPPEFIASVFVDTSSSPSSSSSSDSTDAQHGA